MEGREHKQGETGMYGVRIRTRVTMSVELKESRQINPEKTVNKPCWTYVGDDMKCLMMDKPKHCLITNAIR